MTLLYNFEKQQIEKVPEEEVTNLVASGTYAPRKGVRIPVWSPDGTTGTIPSENAQKAFLQGFRFHTRAESEAATKEKIAKIKEDAYDAPVTAALAGVARGATFGLSDVAMRGVASGLHALGLRSDTGEETAEALQTVREQSPVASTIGEVTGAVAGGFTATPVAAVAKLGTKVAKAATAGELAAKGTAGAIAAEIMAKGAGSAVEGAFYGAGELLTEEALGDPNLTAQNAAIVFGSNVLLGGAIGGLVPGAATAAKAAKEKIGKILVEDMNAPAKAMDAFGKLVSFAKISDPEQQAALKALAEPTVEARAVRERVFDLISNPEKVSDKAVEAVDKLTDIGKWEADVLGSLRETSRSGLERVKYAKTGDKLSEIAPITSKLTSAIDEATTKSNRYVGSAASDLKSVLDDLTAKAGKAENLAEMHVAVHDARMVLDDLFEGARKGLTPEAINTRKLIGGVRSEMKSILTSEKFFPGYGEKFSRADEAFNNYLSAAKEFKTAFQKRVNSLSGAPEFETARGKAARLVKNPLSDVAIEKSATLQRMSDSIGMLSDASAKFADDPVMYTKLKEATEGIQRNLEQLKEARSAAILLDGLEARTGRSILAPLVGMGLGTAAGEMGLTDVPGMGVAGFLGGALLANPKTVMTYLMRLERGNIAAANAIDEASKKYLSVKVPSTVSGALGTIYSGRKMGVSELSRMFERDESDKHLSDADLIKTKLSPLQTIDALDSVVKNQHPLLDDIAPNVYAAKANTQMRALQFLQTKFPKDRDALFAGTTALSTSQKIRLDRYVAAAFNPSELLHEMGEGSVRPETVEAVRAVYPEVYQQIVAKLTETLADPKLQRTMTNAKKNELAKVLGVPTTETLQNISMLQKSWELVPDVEPSQVRPKAAAANMSPSEAIQSRMGS